jgi:hypothetical protein
MRTSITQTASATAMRRNTRTDEQRSTVGERRLTLFRGPSTDHGTPGLLLREDGSRIAYTLELPWRENKRMRSSIPPGALPAGQYPVRCVVTEKRGPVYLLKNVPGRSSILIHSGNVAGDVEKGLESDVLGCILLGQARGYRRGQRAVLLSKPAISAFMREMNRKPFTLEVIPWISAQS